tara:strand:+ start:1966 stop:2310 length:345 start_codon:yes stop_codon:yes gene_type:complete
MYWRPNSLGYTYFKRDAGRYTKEEVDLRVNEGVSAIPEDEASPYSPACNRLEILEDMVITYEKTLREIATDEHGFLDGKTLWPCYKAISALYYDGRPITQDEYRAGKERLNNES